MSEPLTGVFHDAATGETIVRGLTEQEIADRITLEEETPEE